MRIAILAVLLAILLGPDLRSVAAPTRPQATMIRSGQLAYRGDGGVRSGTRGFGLDWFAPPLLAALGMVLLRSAWRMQSAERGAPNTE